MRRASGAAFALVLAAGAAVALADDEPRTHYELPGATTRGKDPIASRPLVDAQLAGEADSVARATAIVADKLRAADATRVARLRAAYRVLQAPLPADASDADRLVAARRRAAARLLAGRDAHERGLLADELAHLDTARTRVATDTARSAELALPEAIGWPVAHGPVTIARRFGAFQHERSRAQLSRRGLDLDTDDHALAVASADGTVRYAGPIRGLDDGVVVDHGTYYTIVAKLAPDEARPPVGAVVHAGDRLGHVARHRLYFEVRVKLGPGGIPIDPEAVLAAKKPR